MEIKRLEEFKNFENFKTVWKAYKDEIKQSFVISDSHLLNENEDKETNKDCVYKNVKYVCIYGHLRHDFKKDSSRNTR